MPRNGSLREREIEPAQWAVLIIHTKVGHGDAYDVRVRHNLVLSVDGPHAIIGKVKGALNLALIDPVKSAHEVGIVRTGRCNREHSHETSGCIRENINNDAERTLARRRRGRVVAEIEGENNFVRVGVS